MGKMRIFFYLCAVLLIVIPTSIVLMTNVPFSSTFSHLVISAALILIILGKLITVIEKRNIGEKIAPELGVIMGLSIVLILKLI